MLAYIAYMDPMGDDLWITKNNPDANHGAGI